MSFGFSIGDVFAVSNFALNVYKDCKAAPTEFRAASSQAHIMHVVLQEIYDSWNDLPRTLEQEECLRLLCGRCREILNALQELLKQYESLGTDAPGKRDRFAWNAERALELRRQLSEQVGLLNSFQTSLVSSSQGHILTSQAQIERKLDQLILDIQRGEKDGNLVTSAIDQSLDESTRISKMNSALQSYNVSPDEIQANKSFIATFLQDAFAEGRLQVRVNHEHRAAPGHSGRGQASNQGVLPTEMPQRQHLKMWVLLIGLPFIGVCINPFMEKHWNKADYKKLREAISRNDLEKARSRMKSGTSAPWLETQGFHGLHLAAEKGWIDMARLLVSSGIPVTIQDSQGKRPLHRACENGNSEIAELLLQYDEGQILVRDYKGETVLHSACGNFAGRSLRMVRRLVDRGAEIEARNDDNETPLLVVLRSVASDDKSEKVSNWTESDVQVVEYLLKQGARGNVMNDTGKGPLQYLDVKPDQRVENLLLRYSGTY